MEFQNIEEPKELKADEVLYEAKAFEFGLGIKIKEEMLETPVIKIN